jgi:tetratricopeptide (TPR) repeat protein
MEFDSANHVVRLCVQGMVLDAQGKGEEAQAVFGQARETAGNDFERFLAMYFVAKQQIKTEERLHCYEESLRFAISAGSLSAQSAYSTLYGQIAQCYEALGDLSQASKYKAMAETSVPTDPGPFYHGTRADLKVGDLLTPGGSSNYENGLVMNHIYFTALVNGAGLAAAMAKGDERERVYIVEPTGSFENDPNVTDKKFPGNQTRSYRSSEPLKIVGEVTDWARQSPEQLQQWRNRVASNMGAIIN